MAIPEAALPYLNQSTLLTANEELISQYSESRNLKLYMRALLEPFVELQDVHAELQYTVTLDLAKGDGLGIVGDIIGKPRLPVERPSLYFGWQGIVGAEPFGTIGNPAIGAPFKTNADNFKSIDIVPVNDVEYRPLLRSQLTVNTSSMTINDIREISLAIIQSQTDCTIEEFVSEYKVTFPTRITQIEKKIIAGHGVPKPAGVLARYADIDGDIAFEEEVI